MPGDDQVGKQTAGTQHPACVSDVRVERDLLSLPGQGQRRERALEVNLRIKRKKRLLREKPEPLAVPETINHVWSMDSMCNQLSDGRSFCLFNVLAMDRQPRAPQHSTWRDYPNSKTGTHRLAPLLAAAKKCGITLSEDCLVSSLRMIKKALRGGDEMPHGQRK